MSKIYTFLLVCALFAPISNISAQTNILSTNALAHQVLLGNYDPGAWPGGLQINDPAQLGSQIAAQISAQNLKSLIIRQSEFYTRNTGSDTVSATRGIGAARRWVYSEFQSYNAANGNRLLPAYLQFDQTICEVDQHRNIFAVLPGTDPASGVMLVEGHIDSRCSVLCDTSCLAQGVEDNATGAALVMELARVMSNYSFPNTIVFLVTIGEEQGLAGAEAFAAYAQANNIKLRGVLNNDVIGGVICGKTSSPPSCSGYNEVDSTSVRLFSSGSVNSKHKQLARFIKLEYRENVLPGAPVQMNVRIMSPEDRTGRGGDHIPFRQKSYPAMRLTAANEHGDASNDANYTDRQHTSSDVLGVDTDNNNEVDSFYVDFNYLARNTGINANALAIAARNVALPATDFTATRSNGMLTVSLNTLIDTFTFRIAVRTTSNDWDTVFTVQGNSATVPCVPTGPLFVSIAGVDNWGAESLFGIEKLITMTTATEEPGAIEEKNIRLFQNRPNPFDEATWITFWVNEVPAWHSAQIVITDIQGREIAQVPVDLKQGMNEVLYTHGYGVSGTFAYTLKIDGAVVESKQMIFAN